MRLIKILSKELECKMSKWRMILKNDLKLIRRDKMLAYMFIMPIMVLVIFRILVDQLQDNLQFQAILPSFLGLTFILIPMFFGFMLGFIFLDEKDDNVLATLRIIPITPEAFIFYRMILGFGFTFIFTLFAPLALDVVELNWIETILVSFMVAFEAPALAFLISMRANNKVEGLAMFKIFGFLTMIPFASAFITSDWQYLFGLIYTYWPIKFIEIIATNAPNQWIIYLVGISYHILLIRWAGKSFKSHFF